LLGVSVDAILNEANKACNISCVLLPMSKSSGRPRPEHGESISLAHCHGDDEMRQIILLGHLFYLDGVCGFAFTSGRFGTFGAGDLQQVRHRFPQRQGHNGQSPA
jgi:hypothetical protein